MRARRLVRTLQGIDEPPLDPRSRVYEVAIFSQLDAHPGVIYSDYKSARLPRWNRAQCLPLSPARGRSNASIIHDPRRLSSICESVSMSRTFASLIFPHAHNLTLIRTNCFYYLILKTISAAINYLTMLDFFYFLLSNFICLFKLCFTSIEGFLGRKIWKCVSNCILFPSCESIRILLSWRRVFSLFT